MGSRDTKMVRAVCTDRHQGDNVSVTLLELPADLRFDLFQLLDRMMSCVTQGRFRFLSELNGLQSDDRGNTVFANKSDIPLRIVNLLLEPYCIKVEEFCP